MTFCLWRCLKMGLSLPVQLYNAMQCDYVSEIKYGSMPRTIASKQVLTSNRLRKPPCISICICLLFLSLSIRILFSLQCWKGGFHCFCKDCKQIKDSDLTAQCQMPMLYDTYFCKTPLPLFRIFFLSIHQHCTEARCSITLEMQTVDQIMKLHQHISTWTNP